MPPGALLIAVLGDAALCPVCCGTGRIVYVRNGQDLVREGFDPGTPPLVPDGWRRECDGGYKRLTHRDFTQQFVRGWGEERVMSRAAMPTWLDQHRSAAQRPGDCRSIDADSPASGAEASRRS